MRTGRVSGHTSVRRDLIVAITLSDGVLACVTGCVEGQVGVTVAWGRLGAGLPPNGGVLCTLSSPVYHGCGSCGMSSSGSKHGDIYTNICRYDDRGCDNKCSTWKTDCGGLHW